CLVPTAVLQAKAGVYCLLPDVPLAVAATAERYSLSLHDALPICRSRWPGPATAESARSNRHPPWPAPRPGGRGGRDGIRRRSARSEEHTSELQSRENLVCRLLLEKKNAYSLVHDDLPAMDEDDLL